jgi:hypothetical protein
MAFTHSAGWQPNFGGILKSVGEGGTYGALCVRYGSEFERDISSEWFDSETDFCFDSASISVPSLFNHSVPIGTSSAARKFANAVFPNSTIERVDGGLFGTIKLSSSDPLQSAVASMIKKGALRFSSGSAMQFVKRVGGHIIKWKILELSMTPQAAEFRLPKIRQLTTN